MARFSRMKTLSMMVEIGVIPVFYTPEINIAKEIVRSLYQGDALCIEMTNRGDGAIDVFKELEKFCISNCPEVILGIGSVIDSSTAAMYISYGANFVVGPAFDRDTAIVCNSRKIPYLPGCGTVTEIHTAESFGVEICKIFPGKQVGGQEFVKSVKGPCPWTAIMPTGGVYPTLESLTEWFRAGVSCVGIGSNLITKEIIKNKDFKKLSEDVKKVIGIIRDLRNKK